MRETQLLHASALIAALHPAPDASMLVEITGLAPKRQPVKRYFTRTDLAAEYAVDANAERYSTFVNVNPRSVMRGFEIDVPFTTALPLDLQPERTSIEGVAAQLTAAGIPPSIVGVSGHGAHMYLLLSERADRNVAKRTAARLVKYTGSDPIHNSNRIMRCAGTVNWKNPPAWCFLTGVFVDRRYTLLQVEAALDRVGAPSIERKGGTLQPSVDPPQDWFELRKRLPGSVLDVIDTGEKNAYSEKQVTRSEADWMVVCALVRAGAPDEMIRWVYDSQPVGLLKYHDSGERYLNRTIESARRANAQAAASPHVSAPHPARSTGSGRSEATRAYRERTSR